MPLLIYDVSLNRANLRLAYAKGSVSALPCELAQSRKRTVNPARGIRFDCAHRIRHRFILPELSQYMDVIHAPIDADANAALRPNRASGIRVQPGANFRVQPGLTFLRRKHNVVKQICV